MRTFKAPVIVKSVQTLVDSGCKLSVVTRELAPEEMALMFTLRGVEAWMLLAPNDIDESEIPDTPAKFDDTEKTPGQRLRGALFRLWEQTDQRMAFELYYKVKMEVITEKIKQEINQ